ncbi:protein Eaa [Salmonella enterica]
MTTITREQLIEKLQNRIAVTANYPGVEEAQLDAAIFKIALASLEAKPIGAFHIADQQVSGTTDYIKDGEWPIDNGVIEVYAAPPAPVVPEKMNFSTACNFVQINGMAKEDRATLAMRTWNAAIEKFKEMNKCL